MSRNLALEEFLARQVAAGHFPGAAYAVVSSEGLLHSGRVGLLAVEPNPLELPAGAAYDVASLTKPLITATVAMRLRERGALDFSAPVHKFFASAAWEPGIRLEHLLLHTSGLPAWRPLHEAPDPFAALLDTPLERPTGELAVYSCLGFILLGRILELATGASLRELGRELVLRPLGMRHSWFSGEPPLAPVAPTELGVPPGVVHDANARALGGAPGNAGLFSTLQDLGLYATDLLRSLRGRSGLLTPEAALQMIETRASGLDEARSWGWMVQGSFKTSAGDRMGPRAFGHTGFTGTSLFFDPARDRAFVLLTNRVHPRPNTAPMFQIRRQFHDLCGGIEP